MGRASDDTREQAVAALRTGLVEGRLGTDTFVRRVDSAYHARTHDELAPLTADLPRRRRPLRALLDLLAPAEARAPTPLEPPDVASGKRLTLGRDNSCDYVVADLTVSSRHAALERLEDGWLIRDLESRNGTRVNGWRVAEQQLRAGDTVEMGTAVFVFRPGAEAPGG